MHWHREHRDRSLAEALEAIPYYWPQTVSRSHWDLGRGTRVYLDELRIGPVGGTCPGDDLDSSGNFFDLDQAAHRGVNILFDPVSAGGRPRSGAVSVLVFIRQ